MEHLRTPEKRRTLHAHCDFVRISSDRRAQQLEAECEPYNSFTILLRSTDNCCERIVHAASMKMINTKPNIRILFSIGLLAAAEGGSALLIAAKPAPSYVAHEWGTFTSVQGSDGVLLDWRPLETSRLPKFVYDWTRPGANRQAGAGQIFGKGGLVTRQRMETPVIYFYSEKEQTVNVSIQFPQGLITEWYPQASQIGPSTVAVPPVLSKLDNYVHQAGVSPRFTFAAFLANHGAKESRAEWADLKLLPEKDNAGLSKLLPFDRSGSHYFAARETDSDYLEESSLVATNPSAEREKFIFYRGAGNFGTPLRVTLGSGEASVLSNTGKDTLEHLFVLDVHEGAGSFIHIERLASGEEKTVTQEPQSENKAVAELARNLGDRMAEALVKSGLYPRESSALVKTWSDSWFQEEGLRVLYILPRAWTDQTLPLKLEPAPHELARVMIGRAEVITPTVQSRLADSLTKASQGDDRARQVAIAQFRKLGRFGEPALRLVTRGASQEMTQTAWTLLHEAASMPANVAKAF